MNDISIPLSRNGSDNLIRALENARKKFLETTSKRNPLLNINRKRVLSSRLNIMDGNCDDVFVALCGEKGRSLPFKPTLQPATKSGEEKLQQSSLQETKLQEIDENGEEFLSDGSTLFVRLEPEKLASRLKKIDREAHSIEEERGLNLLFLAMGFLHWEDSSSSKTNYEAPLILLPVDLVEDRKKSTYRLKFREEEMTANLPLQERLRQDFGVTLPDIAEDRNDDWSPSSYFEKVEQAISSQTGWSIDHTGMQLGFFSFDKLQMYRDLDVQSWPKGWLENHELLNKVLCRRAEQEEREHQELACYGSGSLDKLYSPKDLVQILDADASQTIAIEAVRRGDNLVIQGPPGTGKSQTIANILAAAAHDGKTVLFVAEKQAALSVVYDRLVRCGLSDICLQLHSHQANKKLVLEELDKTLKDSTKKTRTSPNSCEQHLHQVQGHLNNYTDLLHLPLEEGENPYSALCEIMAYRAANAPPPKIAFDGLEKLGKETREETAEILHRLVQALEKSGNPADHPFKGVRQLDLQPLDLDRLKIQLDEAINSLAALSPQKSGSFASWQNFIATLHILSQAPEEAEKYVDVLFPLADDPRLMSAFEVGASWQNAHADASSIFLNDAFATPMAALKQAIVAGKSSLWQRWFGSYRQACATCKSLLQSGQNSPKQPDDYLRLVNQLMDVEAKRAELAEEEAWLQHHLQHLWRGGKTEFSLLAQVGNWIKNIKAAGIIQTAERLISYLSKIENPAQLAEKTQHNLDRARDKVAEILSNVDFDLSAIKEGCTLLECDLITLCHLLEGMKTIERYDEWSRLQKTIKAARLSAAKDVVERILNRELPATSGVDEFHYACAGARWQYALTVRPGLSQLRDMDRHLPVKRFVELERQRYLEMRQHVLVRHYQRVPQGYGGAMGIIRSEISKKRRFKSIRRLIKEAGATVQRIKPIFLMSPLSVAQFIVPGSIEFDIVVMDEASQIKPEEALGCIARAKQLVVVGDKKQLPPTSFFDRFVNDETEDEDEDEGEETTVNVNDMESILTLCEASEFEQCMLRWHYRSRDPSLIQKSNEEFYGGQLALPSPPRQKDENYGLKFRRVGGIYSPAKGGSGRANTNRIEAEAIVKTACDHARRFAELSLGIVAFSKHQADMILEILEREMQNDPVLENFYQQKEHQSEPLFVKNIENVQGDERDVILISVCFGPDQVNGRLARQNFGPINNDGGERRLNVLFSRARYRCEVFASFDPTDIDPMRSKNSGPRILRDFLIFARDEVTGDRIPTGGEADSPFEEDVAREIEKLGFKIHHQVGSEGFKIDIAVLHPTKPWHYILAVECDGARYHSSISARERDRLRQEILEKQGWQFHRIWSTDWYYRREQEISRLAEAIEKAQFAAENPSALVVPPAPQIETIFDEEEIEAVNYPEILKGTPYIKAEIQAHSDDLYQAPISELAELVYRIVKIEGPIHNEEIARRLASTFGLGNAGNKIQGKRDLAVAYAHKQYEDLCIIGDFICTTQQQDTPPVRDRSKMDATTRRAEHLSAIEILAAAEMAIEQNGTMTQEELSQTIANLLGFQRRGPNLAQVIDGTLTQIE